MNNIKNKIIVFGAIITLGLFSACDYLEFDDEKVYTDDLIWSEFDYIKRYMASVYDQVPHDYNHVDGAMLATATDDAEHANRFSDVSRFNTGSWGRFNNPDDAWERNYKGIHRANMFIESADTATLQNDINDQVLWQVNFDKLTAFRGEARFLKAFFYFELIKRYGGVPILDNTVGLGELEGVQRDTYNECVSYIATTCDDAIKYLPGYIDISADNVNVGGSSDRGRASDAAAYALKARTYLYAASALNNPSGTYDAYYDSCASNAAKIINMGYYTLSGVDYDKLFTPGDGLHRSNKEVIFDQRKGTSNEFEKDNFPIGFYNGKGETNPSQNLVDSYEMKDGSSFNWNNPDHASNPYENRDARFYASVIYNGMSMAEREVETYNGGLDGPNQEDYFGTYTGYYLKKGVNIEIDLLKDEKEKHFWFYFRYAEVLLNYAEAMNELHGPDTDPSAYGLTAREAINQVRSRAGQPDVVAADQSEFREKLRNERRVELAFEDHRFWDVRRWNIAESTLGAPIMGVDIAMNQDSTFNYSLKTVENRVFESKMYLYPIPHSELANASALDQNPGW